MSQAQITPEQHVALNAAISEEYERTAQLRKVIPEVEMPGAIYGVMVPTLDGSSLSMTDYALVKPVMLSLELGIPPLFLEDFEGTLTLVRAAARRMAIVEDQLLAYGSEVIADGKVLGVRVVNAPSSGLWTGEPDSMADSTSMKATLTTALGDLADHGYHGPFAGVFTLAGLLDARATEGDPFAILASMVQVPGPTPSVVFEPGSPAISPYVSFVSIDGLGCDLVRVSTPTGQVRGHDASGNLRYVLEEQFLLRMKDPRVVYKVWIASAQ